VKADSTTQRYVL